ncbi:MAG TPA: inositol monophosphatase family protein [Acidimicrobiia bacterium]|nr:inositol monophosphatase family protein [Acidimicrobiia bacterium]
MASAGLDLDALLDTARRAALAGGAVVAEACGGPLDVRTKGPGDWVSDADTASERAVRDLLTAAAPTIPVFGEELGGERAALGWLVDPLDGTTNFLHRFPVVGVSVALVEGDVPLVGAVHAPLLGDIYTARRGGGAFRNDQLLHVSTRPPGEGVLATGTPFRAKRTRLDEYLAVFRAALLAFEDLRRAGAASLDLAWTASGSFDGYFEAALGPWDMAAGALLVREAGGRVTDWRGDPDAWLRSGDIVAAPPAVHEALLGVIAETT